MNASEALELTKSNIPLIEDKEYDSIIKDIKRIADNGGTEKHFLSYFSLPSSKVMDRLNANGYHFHAYKCFPFPEMYSICWKNHPKRKRNWLERLLYKN